MARVDDEHARPGHDALLDCLLQLRVGVAGALRAEIADRREAGEQRRAGWATARARCAGRATPCST